MATIDDVRILVELDNGLASVSTVRPDGSLQSTVVNAGIIDHERLRLLLRDVFEAAGGTHEDYAEYDRVVAAERRVAVLVTPSRIYQNP